MKIGNEIEKCSDYIYDHSMYGYTAVIEVSDLSNFSSPFSDAFRYLPNICVLNSETTKK